MFATRRTPSYPYRTHFDVLWPLCCGGTMPSPVLNDKRFEEPREEWQPGWAAGAQTQTQGAGGTGRIVPIMPGAMTASGTFAKTGVLFVILLAAGAYGWSQVTASPTGEIE